MTVYCEVVHLRGDAFSYAVVQWSRDVMMRWYSGAVGQWLQVNSDAVV